LGPHSSEVLDPDSALVGVGTAILGLGIGVGIALGVTSDKAQFNVVDHGGAQLRQRATSAALLDGVGRNAVRPPAPLASDSLAAADDRSWPAPDGSCGTDTRADRARLLLCADMTRLDNNKCAYSHVSTCSEA
jgi:hypothetical protein